MKFFIYLFILSALCFRKPSWTDYALMLSGESLKARQQAISALLAYNNLELILKTALKTENKYLALDVISALKLKGFLEELLDLSNNDSEGFFYLTINTLIDEKNKTFIAKTYIDRLKSKKLSPSASAIIIETLGYWGAILEEKTLDELLGKSFEERMAMLTYIRYLAYKYKRNNYSKLLLKTIKMEPYQLRIKTIFLISELGLPLLEERTCLNERNTEVRKICLKTISK